MLMAQIFAVIIFIGMFILIVTELIERHISTLICGGLTLVLTFGVGMRSLSAIWETLNISSIFSPHFWYSTGGAASEASGINWETIIFIFGMMVMVEGMAHSGFFRWLCMKLASAVNYKILPLLVTFMVLSGVLAMFIDSITVILFLAAVIIELAQLLKFNPVPMVLASIFCANLGGSATMCGDPPNIIIGTSLGYTFADFISNTGVIAGICMIAVIIYFFFTFKKELTKGASQKIDPASLPAPSEAITSIPGFITSTLIFLCAVVLLVTHAMTGFSVALIGVFIAAVTLITSYKHALELLKKIDYKTLLFFIGLFTVVGGLEKTGILEIIASFIMNISGGNAMIMVAIIIWISAAASAFVDNIPFAATMVPVISTLSAASGVNLPVLAWSLAMGADIGGSATPIGASANVVGIATAAKEGYIIRWGKYCKVMAPATVIVMALTTVLVYIRYI